MFVFHANKCVVSFQQILISYVYIYIHNCIILFQQRLNYINVYMYIWIQCTEYSALLQHALSGCWLPCIWNRSDHLNFATLCCTKRQSAQGFCMLEKDVAHERDELLPLEISLPNNRNSSMVSLHETIAWFVQNPAEHGMSQLINGNHMSYVSAKMFFRINWEFHLVPFKELRARSQRLFFPCWRHVFFALPSAFF